jgi:hypothetical protein
MIDRLLISPGKAFLGNVPENKKLQPFGKSGGFQFLAFKKIGGPNLKLPTEH